MYLRLYLCCLILLLPTLSGCSVSVTGKDFSKRTKLFLTCMNEMWDYERNCMCEVYPKGYTKEDYCDTWTSLRMNGYNVPLDIPITK